MGSGALGRYLSYSGRSSGSSVEHGIEKSKTDSRDSHQETVRSCSKEALNRTGRSLWHRATWTAFKDLKEVK